MEWLASFYLWLKAFHIISVIAWMAGLLYLPRLFVYHAEAAPVPTVRAGHGTPSAAGHHEPAMGAAMYSDHAADA
jgi:hypothetical protein